jgi:hypothetical protein
MMLLRPSEELPAVVDGAGDEPVGSAIVEGYTVVYWVTTTRERGDSEWTILAVAVLIRSCSDASIATVPLCRMVRFV